MITDISADLWITFDNFVKNEGNPSKVFNMLQKKTASCHNAFHHGDKSLIEAPQNHNLRTREIRANFGVTRD